MLFNEMWPSYIIGSLNKYFKNTLTGQKFYTIAEDPRLNTSENYYWLRVDGPTSTPEPSGFWRLEVTINLLIACFIDHDLYRLDRMVGLGVKAFANEIAAYEIPTDPLTQIGCLTLISDKVDVHRYGQEVTDIKLIQASVEGTYAIDF